MKSSVRFALYLIALAFMAALSLAVMSTSAQAAMHRCVANDRWVGADKAMHFKAGGAIGAVVTVVTEKPSYGFWSGVAAGALAELKDARTPGHVCSLQDLVATAAGAAAGAYGTAWLIVPKRDGVQVAFVKRI